MQNTKSAKILNRDRQTISFTKCWKWWKSNCLGINVSGDEQGGNCKKVHKSEIYFCTAPFSAFLVDCQRKRFSRFRNTKTLESESGVEVCDHISMLQSRQGQRPHLFFYQDCMLIDIKMLSSLLVVFYNHKTPTWLFRRFIVVGKLDKCLFVHKTNVGDKFLFNFERKQEIWLKSFTSSPQQFRLQFVRWFLKNYNIISDGGYPIK